MTRGSFLLQERWGGGEGSVGMGGIVCEPGWRDGLQLGSSHPPGKLLGQRWSCCVGLGWHKTVARLW